jgi:very-short-patch-repair endonuclease
MDRLELLHDVAAERHAVVTTSDGADLAIPGRTMRGWAARRELVRLWPDVYIVPRYLDDRTHLTAVQAHCPEAIASHRAAGLLHELDGIEHDAVEVTVPPRVNIRRGAIVHRSTDLVVFEVVTIDGLRVTDPTRTLCDLGAVVGVNAVERAVESALRRQLTDVPTIVDRATALRRPGRAGPNVVLDVLGRRPARAMPTESDLETLFLQCLREHGVPEPVRQHRVLQNGRVIARLDMAYPPARVLVELDSWKHHSSPAAFQRDRSRQNAVVIDGWRPLRFTWTDVMSHGRRTASIVQSAISCQ